MGLRVSLRRDNMLIWLGGGVPPNENPDLVAESAEQEEKAVRLTEKLWPMSKDWMRGN